MTCCHVGHGEVHGSLPDGGDGHVYDGHVRLLRPQVGDHPRPPPVLETAVAAPAIYCQVRDSRECDCAAVSPLHQVELILELDFL